MLLSPPLASAVSPKQICIGSKAKKYTRIDSYIYERGVCSQPLPSNMQFFHATFAKFLLMGELIGKECGQLYMLTVESWRWIKRKYDLFTPGLQMLAWFFDSCWGETKQSFFLFISSSPFCPQLLPVPAPGGCCRVEDQTKLLGVTATRGKSSWQ